MNSQQKALNVVQTGSTGTQADQLDREYYDELVIAAAPLTNRMFMTPLAAAGKLLDQTNFPQAGIMPANRRLDVAAIRAEWVSETTGGIKATAADVQALFTQLHRTTVQLFINNREWGTWTIAKLMGLNFAVAVNPALTLNMPFPEPRFFGITPLNNQIPIVGNTNFYIEVVHSVVPTAATIGDRFRIGLIGTEVRLN